MGVFRRMKHAALAAYRALRGMDVNTPEWDTNRIGRYDLYDHFFYNTVFTELNTALSILKAQYSTYAHIRSPYNPVERAVEGYVSAIYGGRIDLTNIQSGAIPVVSETDSEIEALRFVLRKTGLKTTKNIYARNAARYGDAYLKIVDIPDSRTFRVKSIDPRHITDVRKDHNDDIIYVCIKTSLIDDSGTGYQYKEIITPEYYATYKNDLPFGYGGRPAQWDNPYGFVPVVHAKFRDDGAMFGVNAFQAQIPKIIEVNDLASMITDSVRNVITPLVHARGINKGALATNSDEISRDSIRIIYTAAGNGELLPIQMPIDIPGSLATLNRLLDELEDDLPVLALHRIRDMQQVTAPGVTAAFSDVVDRIIEVQSNLDAGVEKILAMAVAIAGMRGYVSGYRLNYYTENRYTFYIDDRPIINDELSKRDKIQALLSLNPELPTAPDILKRLGFTDNEIEALLGRVTEFREDRIEEAVLTNQNTALSNFLDLSGDEL